MFTITVVYTFPTGRESDAESFLRDLIAGSRAEPGCRRYEVFRNVETPRSFLIFEQYDDEAAFEAHRASEHFARSGKGGIQTIAESRTATEYGEFV